MTPQEKALKLCQRFGVLGMDWKQTGYYTLDLENGKQCALIAVEEIIELMKGKFMCERENHNESYWEQVKQEIEKL